MSQSLPMRAEDLPSGPVMFLAEVLAEAIAEQATIEDLGNGVWWLSGGVTPQTAGRRLNLRDVAESVLLEMARVGSLSPSPNSQPSPAA